MTTFVWMDMEFTGLNPSTNKILEIATIITDTNFEILEELPVITISHQLDQLRFDLVPGTEAMMQKTFTESGLFERIEKSTTTLAQADSLLLTHIEKHSQPQECYLAGNGVWRDRYFLENYLPLTNDYLHYRLIDVTSIKLLVRNWLPEIPPFEKTEVHDARLDIQASIEELKYYREKLFLK